MSIFNKVEAPSLQKYAYNLSHEFKFSNNFGYLTPISCLEVLPGDTFQMNSEVFMRMAPLVHPIMQRMNVDVHHFFVPYRIIWNQFEEFITGFSNDDAGSVIPQKVPQIHVGSYISKDDSIFHPGSLPHFFGVPFNKIKDKDNFDISMSALPFRAYVQIYNDYYRDSIKDEKIVFDKSSSDITYSDDDAIEPSNILCKRLRRYTRDYFTTSQPTPQLGDPAVLPSPILNQAYSYSNYASGPAHLNRNGSTSNIGGSTAYTSSLQGDDTNAALQIHHSSGNYTLSDGEPFTINKLRELFSLQKLFDIGNKFGSRYTEQTLGHFGVRSSDARLQRAQYLGGGRVPVMINQINQLSEGTSTSPLGYQAGQGIASGSDNYFSQEFEEHGLIISILSILPEMNYTTGISKFMLKSDRFDFAFPELSQLGEQEVNILEYNINGDPDNAFGYQERYAEYKSMYNRVAGDFLTSLRGFYVSPSEQGVADVMSGTYVCDPRDLQNIFAITDGSVDKFYFQIYHNITKHSVLPYLNRNINPLSYI